jgi:hypothetical protein
MIHGPEIRFSSAIFTLKFVMHRFNRYFHLPLLFGLLLYERKDFICGSGDGIRFSLVTFKCIH